MTKLLLCIIASLLLCSCGNRTRDFPQDPKIDPKIDQEFLTLVDQAISLSAVAEEWNKECGRTQTNETAVAVCSDKHDQLSSKFSTYIARALQYKSEGDDCRALLRQRIIGFNIHIALFNIKCAGVLGTEGCNSEAIFVEQERVDLSDKMAQCEKENQSQSGPDSTKL